MKKGLIIGGVIILAAIGFLLYMSFGDSTIYYVTVSELIDKGAGGYDTDIRVTGVISEGSIDWNAEKLELKFAVEEGGAVLPVIYEGSKPDGFTDGADILVEGEYSKDKIFHASTILMKCPSKYTEEE